MNCTVGVILWEELLKIPLHTNRSQLNGKSCESLFPRGPREAKNGIIFINWGLILFPVTYEIISLTTCHSVEIWEFLQLRFYVKSISAECGNFMIFLSLRFYVKAILEHLEVQNLPFNTFRGSELWFLWIFALFQDWYLPNGKKGSLRSFRFYLKSIFEVPEVLKMPFLAILEALNFVDLVNFSL